jgi:membrane glycosyltransferase
MRAAPFPRDRSTGARALALAASLLAAAAAGMVFQVYGAADGVALIDVLRSLLIFLSTWWLAWGAATALLGLTSRPQGVPAAVRGPIAGRTVVIVPVYNEDPVTTFARIAAMDDSIRAAEPGLAVSFAILSDTRDEAVAAEERAWFARWSPGRTARGGCSTAAALRNTGRKAGNVEDFVATSGGAWDYAVILDADSLMEGATILEMIRRIEAEPRLGLLQTLPRVVRARSRFGRAMQFAAGFHSPVFARGLAAMQGRTGPFWGHNAIVRLRAWAESCGLPELPGRAPFGGHILSHDYVEAALLARAGWTVRLDPDLGGSYEEGPENIIDHAKRDRRWCQGNLQHAAVIAAPGLAGWSRFTFFQGIFAYVAPLIWLAFIAASVAAVFWADLPDYFPQANWPFPVFPNDQTPKAIGLGGGGLRPSGDAQASGRAGGRRDRPGRRIRRTRGGGAVDAGGTGAVVAGGAGLAGVPEPLGLAGAVGARRRLAAEQPRRRQPDSGRGLGGRALDQRLGPGRPGRHASAGAGADAVAVAGDAADAGRAPAGLVDLAPRPGRAVRRARGTGPPRHPAPP